MFSQEDLNVLLTPLADAVSTPVDQVRVLVFLFLSFPMAWLFKQVPGKTNRMITSVVTGSLFIYYTCGLWGLLHTLIASTIAYAMMKFMDRSSMGFSMFVYMFTYMSTYHIYRIYVNYLGWDMDASGPLMILTIKLTMLACNYSDGDPSKKPEQLRPYWNENKVVVIPNMLEYYSYVFFWVTSVTGPAFHYSHFMPFIDESLFNGKKISTWKPCVTVLSHAILCLAIFFGVGLIAPFEYIFSEEFGTQYFLFKAAYIWLALFGLRFRYYFTWKMAEAAGNLSGFGYRVDGNDQEQWDRLTNVDVLKIELAGNVRDLTTYWNSKTADWLKNYCYFRQTEDPNADPPRYATYLTNCLSAFWHGFYPGYYIAFTLAAFIVDQMRTCRKYFRPLVVITDPSDPRKETGVIQPYKLFYDIAAHILTRIYFTAGMLSFVCLSLERTFIAYGSVYWLAHLTAFVGFFLIRIAVMIIKKNQKKNKD